MYRAREDREVFLLLLLLLKVVVRRAVGRVVMVVDASL